MSEDNHTGVGYHTIFYVLLAALALSLLLGHVSTGFWSQATIYVIALMKAYLVATYFMHVNVEPRFIKVLIVGLVLVLAALLIGVFPDVSWGVTKVQGT